MRSWSRKTSQDFRTINPRRSELLLVQLRDCDACDASAKLDQAQLCSWSRQTSGWPKENRTELWRVQLRFRIVGQRQLSDLDNLSKDNFVRLRSRLLNVNHQLRYSLRIITSFLGRNADRPHLKRRQFSISQS